MTQSLTKFATKVGVVSTTAYIGALGLAQGVLAAPGVDQAAGDVDIDNSVGFAPNLGKLITSVLTLVMLIAALMILIYLIWGGIQWITSGGDKGKTEEARNKITSAVVGLIILAAAWAVFLIILKFLGFASYQDLFANIVNVKGT